MTTDQTTPTSASELVEESTQHNGSQRGRILAYLKENHDQDLQAEQIAEALGLTLDQTRMAIYGIRSDYPDAAGHIELGGNARPGHVRYYERLRDRPLESPARNPKASAKAKVKTKPPAPKRKALALVPDAQQTETSQLHHPAGGGRPVHVGPIGSGVSTSASASHSGVHLDRELPFRSTPEPVAYHAIGQLGDGRVVLTTAGSPDVLLVAEPYVSLIPEIHPRTQGS